MHYRNGREAKNGDRIVQFNINDAKIVAVGVLYDATPGNDYCNGHIAPIQPVVTGACMCDCLHVEDVEDILAKRGMNMRPPIMPIPTDSTPSSIAVPPPNKP